MFMHGEAAVFTAEAWMQQMVTALCGTHPPRIAVADGDDPAMAEEAYRHCRETGIPLIQYSRTPAACPIPADIGGRVLPRPFPFADFTDALRALTDAELPAPAERTPAVPMPVLRWDSERRAVQCGDAEVLLTPREADVFAALYAAMPGAVRREDLLREFARTAGNGADVYISYLRKKLAALPTAIRIHSERGSGYTLLIPSAEGGNTERGSGETR